MPLTSPDNFPFEVVSDQPGISLHGGLSGTEPILAEEIQDKFVTTDADVSDLQSRVTTIENDGILGWTYITHGTAAAAASFDVDLTDGGRLVAGEFDLLRLHMRYGLDDVGSAFCRINADSAGGSGYLYSLNVRDADGNLDVSGVFQTASWNIGQNGSVGNGNLSMTIYHTNGNFAHSFQSTSARHSTSSSSMRYGEHWGNVSGLAAVPSFLRIIASSGATQFDNAWFWAEGFRTP